MLCKKVGLMWWGQFSVGVNMKAMKKQFDDFSEQPSPSFQPSNQEFFCPNPPLTKI